MIEESERLLRVAPLWIVPIPALVALVAVSIGGRWWVVVPLATAAGAAIVDARSRRLPNRLVLATAMSSASASVLAGSPIVALVAVVGAFAGPLLAAGLVVPSAVGAGDVKLAAALAPVVAAGGVFTGLLALCLATGSASVVGVCRRRRVIPLGPALVAGTVVAGTIGVGWSR